MSLCVRVCVSVYVQIATYNHLLTSPIQSIIYSMITELMVLDCIRPEEVRNY